MKPFILFCLALSLLQIQAPIYGQASAATDSSKYVEELAYKLSRSPVYTSFLSETQKLAQEFVLNKDRYVDKEEFKKHSKEEYEKIIHDKNLSYKQKNEALNKMGIKVAVDTNIYTPVRIASANLSREFPELAKLSQQNLKLVHARANELLKASGYKTYTPSVPSHFDKVFTKTKQRPKFPGGEEAFKRYLDRNLKKDAAATDGAPAGVYKVRVQFMVDMEGNVSNVRAIEVPKECPSCGIEAVKVIRRGPKWQPAVQNGRNVVFQNVETISFPVAVL